MYAKDEIGRVYAAALFELARAAHQIDDIKDDLDAIAEVVDNKEFLKLGASPYISREEKSQLLHELFGGRLTNLTADFLEVVTKHNRIPYLPRMAQEYENLADIYYERYPVSVTVAHEVNEQERGKLEEQISEAIKSEIKLHVLIDPSVIGGIVIRYGDTVIDNTVKRELRDALAAMMSRQSQE